MSKFKPNTYVKVAHEMIPTYFELLKLNGVELWDDSLIEDYLISKQF